MAELASKGGKKLVRPVTPLPVPNGREGYSAGSESGSSAGGKQFFLQYILGSSEAFVYLTFEGQGDAVQALEKFDAIIATQQWDN
jgi:hypothetical protein